MNLLTNGIRSYQYWSILEYLNKGYIRCTKLPLLPDMGEVNFLTNVIIISELLLNFGHDTRQEIRKSSLSTMAIFKYLEFLETYVLLVICVHATNCSSMCSRYSDENLAGRFNLGSLSHVN